MLKKTLVSISIFSHIGIAKMVEMLPHGRQNMLIHHSTYHCLWCLSDARSQIIGSHGIYTNILEYFSFITRHNQQWYVLWGINIFCLPWGSISTIFAISMLINIEMVANDYFSCHSAQRGSKQGHISSYQKWRINSCVLENMGLFILLNVQHADQ